MKNIEVVAAIILFENRVLCVQRGENKLDYISKKYEFPGGKIEIGETKTEALKREIFEELKMRIDVLEEFITITHQYPDFFLTMHSFLCKCDSAILTLTEHIDFKWLKKNELEGLDWAEADIPIMKKLLTYQNDL
jgi:8-oxo-dGTP diphosphatase